MQAHTKMCNITISFLQEKIEDSDSVKYASSTETEVWLSIIAD